MSESSSEDENLKLIKESIDPELTNDKLYKNNPEDKIVKSPKDSLRSSVSNNDYTNLLNLAPGTQKYIATQLENYLEQILTKKVAAPCVTITNKRKRKKSKIKLFRNSEHYIELDTFENEVNQPKRKIKQEFDSDDETKIKEILITPEEILSKKEVDNWAKSTRTKHIFQYKKSKTGKNLVEIN